jgi:hypothetical protein
LSEVFGVARADFNQVTVFASDVMHLENFREIHQRLRNPIIRVGIAFITSHGHEGEQAKANGPRIYLRAVPLKDAARFELADSFENSRRGEANGPGDVDLGLPGIRLESLDDLQVRWIE